MACFERASPALKELFLKIHRAERPIEIDHHMHEFGSVRYHVKCSASDSIHTYLSISTPILSQGLPSSSQLPDHTLNTVKEICPDAVEISEPPKEGFQLTLKLNLSRIPHSKASSKMITDISSVQAVILSSQLKEILKNVNSRETYKPIKLVYHPREPFFLIRLPEKITTVFPMRFKDREDVIIATAFLQELGDVGSSERSGKAPRCVWSPIPPPELRGEAIEDLSTDCGFVSFDIMSRHVEGKKLDKTVWNLLNFYTFVKYHVKSTRGFIQRRMRTRLDRLVQHLEDVEIEEDDKPTRRKKKKKKARAGWKRAKKWIRASGSKILRGKHYLAKKARRFRSRIKIRLRMPCFSPMTKYIKLE